MGMIGMIAEKSLGKELMMRAWKASTKKDRKKTYKYVTKIMEAKSEEDLMKIKED